MGREMQNGTMEKETKDKLWLWVELWPLKDMLKS
jgi:hypothetical protein